MSDNLKEIGWFLLSPLVAVAYAATLPLFVPGLLFKLFKDGDAHHDD